MPNTDHYKEGYGSETQSEESDYDDDCSDHSLESSSDDGAWREEDEQENLPTLLNSTRHRKKTIENYIAPVHMRETVYRCKEFPNGVYINRQGIVIPDHPQSTKPFTGKRGRDSFEEEADPPAKHARINEDDDEEEPYESSEELSDSDDSENSIYASDEENSSEDRIASMLTDLKSGADSCAESYERSQKSKNKHVKSMRLVHATQDMVEEWLSIKKKEGRSLHMVYKSSLLVENPFFDLTFMNLLEKKAEESTKYVTASLVCSDVTIQCQCGHVTPTMTEHVAHLKTTHWPILGHMDEIQKQWSEDKLRKTTLKFSYESKNALYLTFKGKAQNEILVSATEAKCTTCNTKVDRSFSEYVEHHLDHVTKLNIAKLSCEI